MVNNDIPVEFMVNNVIHVEVMAMRRVYTYGLLLPDLLQLDRLVVDEDTLNLSAPIPSESLTVEQVCYSPFLYTALVSSNL